MYKVNVTNGKEYAVSFDKEHPLKGEINGEAFALDMIKIKENSFHVIQNNRSYTVELIQAEPSEKSMVISINGHKYSLQVKDKLDELLHSLGFDAHNQSKVNEIKAPMPGLILEIKVKEGDVVKKGDALLVLEAMKMENSLKSPTDAVVKKVLAKKGAAVEKNQVLIQF